MREEEFKPPVNSGLFLIRLEDRVISCTQFKQISSSIDSVWLIHGNDVGSRFKTSHPAEAYEAIIQAIAEACANSRGIVIYESPSSQCYEWTKVTYNERTGADFIVDIPAIIAKVEEENKRFETEEHDIEYYRQIAKDAQDSDSGLEKVKSIF